MLLSEVSAQVGTCWFHISRVTGLISSLSMKVNSAYVCMGVCSHMSMCTGFSSWVRVRGGVLDGGSLKWQFSLFSLSEKKQMGLSGLA